MLISENWPNILLPGLRKVFVNQFREFTSNLPALFSMQTSDKAQEFDVDDDEFLDFAPMTGTIPMDDMKEGYKTTYTHQELARGFKVNRALVMDDQYGVINRKPAMLSLSARRRREKDGASIFNNAFNAGYTGGDGVSLCNASHPSRQDAAFLQSNTSTLPLTPANVETNRRRMSAFRSGRNGIIDVTMDTILVPIELEEKGFEIIKTAGKVDTAQNNVNFHQGRYKMIVWKNFLTSSTAWFSMDSGYMKQFLLWFDREPVQFFRDQDFSTLVASYAGYMRNSQGWSGWRWIYGNNSAS